MRKCDVLKRRQTQEGTNIAIEHTQQTQLLLA